MAFDFIAPTPPNNVAYRYCDVEIHYFESASAKRLITLSVVVNKQSGRILNLPAKLQSWQYRRINAFIKYMKNSFQHSKI